MNARFTALAMTFAELRRRRIILLLLLVIPVVFYSVILVISTDEPIWFQLAAIEAEDYLNVSERAESLVFIGLAAVGLLSSFIAMNMAQKDRDVNRRLVLCGYRPRQLLGAKLGVLAGVVVCLSFLTTAALPFFFRPSHYFLVLAGFILAGWIYGCYGLLIGALFRQELEGVLFIALMTNLDLGWLQNPIYYSHAQQQAVIRSLPGYAPAQLAMAAAFSDHAAAELLRPAIWALAYGLVLLLAALAVYAWRMRIPRKPAQGESKMNYGPPILGNGWLGFAPRLKNRLATIMQQRILAAFAFLSRRACGDRWLARCARRLVGGYLYSLKIEINAACTLACPMCYVEPSGSELSLPVLNGLFAQLRSSGTRIEILGGEPLLHPDIVAIVAGAKARARAPWVSLYTNGIAATPEMAERLRRAGLDAALVTLVSHEEKTHDRFVGRSGSWQKTVAGIRALHAAGIAAYTFTAVHRVNYRHVRDIHHFARNELGVHAVFFHYVPQQANDPLMIERSDWQEIKHWVLLEKNREHADFVRNFFMLTGNACSGGNFVLTVKADGTVQPCPFISDLPLGNIALQNIWAIHRGRYQQQGLREFKSIPAACRDCTYASVCAGSCRAGNRKIFGSYGTPDSRCLGPYRERFERIAVCDRVPTFF